MLDEYDVVAVRGQLAPPLNGERNRWEYRTALEFQGADVDEPHLAVWRGKEVDPGLQFVHGHEFATAARPTVISATMSSIPSMPTARRTSPGVTPEASCSSGVSCECVVEAGG